MSGMLNSFLKDYVQWLETKVVGMTWALSFVVISIILIQVRYRVFEILVREILYRKIFRLFVFFSLQSMDSDLSR